MIGAVLNERYRLDAELGRGGMAIVYRARDTLLERDVAVKVMSAAGLGTEGRGRLMHEAKAAAKLNHPNVVSVYDAGEADGSPFIVMELVVGDSLHDRRPEALGDILAIARQICAALEHAHAHGIIHRDLKPENVLLASDGTAKLTDFGLARSVASRLTSEGTIVGTVFYLAPELALGQEFDGRADLYALGVMLYELTTGRLPFIADDPLAVISQHLHAPVVPPRAKNDQVPPALDTLIVQLLSKDPAGCPASAAEVWRALEQPGLLDTGAVPAKELSMLERIERGRLVGRERELQEARELWNQVLSGRGQTLLVSGEPGIGKTRLVRELVTQAEVSGGRALVGASYAEGGMPYTSFRQILGQVLHGDSEDGFDLSESVLADLLVLAPELRVRYPDVPPNPPLDPRAEQQRLFESLLVFFTGLSEGAPLLLTLEDAHWADSGTLSLLRHLARHTRQGRVMIVATYREVELDEARPLHEVLLDLQRERLATRLRLPRLDRAQTEELLAVLFDEEVTPEFLEGIYRETEGNPFFIEEVCKALVESGRLTYEDGRWHRPSIEQLGIPQSVRVAIQLRVRVLPTAAQETLRLATVLGREFELDTLAEASDQDEDALIEALEDAERAQLIEEVSPEGGGTFAFAHGLIATTLVESLRTLQRRRLHRRAAAAIEARRPDDFEALAYHYDQAGQAEKAVDYLLRAGNRARGLYAHQEAIDNYQQALELLKEAGDLERAARTLMMLGLTHHSAFDFRQARQAYEEGFALWQRAGEAESAARMPLAPHPLRQAWTNPLTLDPGLSNDIASGPIIPQLFSGLVEHTPDLGIVPDVAASWEVLEGGSRVVFHLRDDVHWSDGVPLTAGDFEYAWKRVLDPATASRAASVLYDVQGARAFHQGLASEPDGVGVRAIDDRTLSVELERPVGYLLHLLAHTNSLPVPRHVVARWGATWTDAEKIVTNGPFTLTAWRPGQELVLARNPRYHGRFGGNLERVELSLFPERGRTAEFERYEADLLDVYELDANAPQETDRIRRRHGAEYVSLPVASTYYVAFDVRRAPFDDARVRRAFAYAVDRETLAGVTLGGYCFPASGGLVPPGMPAHSPGIGLPYSPERARDLLAEAGYPGGRGFPTVDFVTLSGRHAMGEHLHMQWRENLGVELQWRVMGFAEFIDLVRSDPPHLFRMGWMPDYPDPDAFLRVAVQLHTAWRPQRYLALVDEARHATDQQERMKAYAEVERMVAEEVPLLPLIYDRSHWLYKPWVRRYPRSVAGGYFWKDVVIEPH